MVSGAKGLISAFAIGSYGLGSLGFNLSTRTCSKRWVWKKPLLFGGDCTGDDCLWRNVNERCAEAEVKTSNGVVEKDYTLAESMRNRSTGC